MAEAALNKKTPLEELYDRNEREFKNPYGTNKEITDRAMSTPVRVPLTPTRGGNFNE